jgi:hypothetical protein
VNLYSIPLWIPPTYDIPPDTDSETDSETDVSSDSSESSSDSSGPEDEGVESFASLANKAALEGICAAADGHAATFACGGSAECSQPIRVFY